jgi:glycosyltransferase involved in cell wall biosynthesis
VNQQNLDITVAIPVRNEFKNLPLCLSRLKSFKHVIVIDSDSTDQTCEIAEQYGARVVKFHWNGSFPKKRNWFLRTFQFETSWVLFLDADEFIDEEFFTVVTNTIKTTSHVGFWLTYSNWFMGKKLRHGDSNRKLALFKVGSGEYERILEKNWTALDMEVHEHPVLDGTIGQINTIIDHHDYRGLTQWFQRHNDYSTWEAMRSLSLDHDGIFTHPELTPRQIGKYKALGRWYFPISYFLVLYIWRLGILDGYAGFAYAFAKSFYFWQIGIKIKEFKKNT